MSCGGHSDKSPNANGLRISEVVKSSGKSWDDCAYIFHGLVSDAKAEISGNEEGRKNRNKELQQSAETRARSLLDLAVSDPGSLSESYSETKLRIEILEKETEGPSLEDFENQIIAMKANPNGDPESLEALQTEYYAALEDLVSDIEENQISVNVQSAMVKENILIINAEKELVLSSESTNLEKIVEDVHSSGYRGIELTSAQYVESSIIVRNALAETKDIVAEMNKNIVDRLDSQKLRKVLDLKTGISMSPSGGVRYSEWKHEKITKDIGEKIAENQNLPESVTQSAIEGYIFYAGVDYYRGPALKDLGLKRGDYSKVNPELRKVRVVFPDPNDAFFRMSAASSVQANEEAYASLPEKLQALSNRMSEMPLDEATRELANVEHSIRTLKRVASSIETEAYKSLVKENLTSTQTRYGEYQPYVTTPSYTWNDNIKNRLIQQVAIDKKLSVKTVRIVVNEYLKVAHASRYKIKSLKKIDIDPDDYRGKGVGTQKISLIEPKAA